MLIDITDDRMKARVSVLPNGMMRFTLDYPREENYARRIRLALADLLCLDKPVKYENPETEAKVGASRDAC